MKTPRKQHPDSLAFAMVERFAQPGTPAAKAKNKPAAKPAAPAVKARATAKRTTA